MSRDAEAMPEVGMRTADAGDDGAVRQSLVGARRRGRAGTLDRVATAIHRHNCRVCRSLVAAWTSEHWVLMG